MTEATFGRRRTGTITGVAPQMRRAAALSATPAGADTAQAPTATPGISHPKTPSRDATAVLSGKTPRWAAVSAGQLSLGVAVILAMLAGLLYFQGGELLRDLRYAGTYKPTNSATVSNGDCTRYQMLLTLCDATIVDKESGNRWTTRFMVSFTGMGGEPLVAMRSTTDPRVIVLGVAAIDYLWNRTLTLGLLVLALGIFFAVGARKLATGRYKDGAAFHALVAELDGITAHQRPQRPAA